MHLITRDYSIGTNLHVDVVTGAYLYMGAKLTHKLIANLFTKYNIP